MADILIVDDSQDIAAICSEVLTDAGHTVVCASDGLTARDAFSREQFELVLLDMMLPGERWASIATFVMERGAALILTSGHPELINRSIDPHGGLPEGALFLAKPFRSKRLVEAIELALARSKATPAKAATTSIWTRR